MVESSSDGCIQCAPSARLVHLSSSPTVFARQVQVSSPLVASSHQVPSDSSSEQNFHSESSSSHQSSSGPNYSSSSSSSSSLRSSTSSSKSVVSQPTVVSQHVARLVAAPASVTVLAPAPVQAPKVLAIKAAPVITLPASKANSYSVNVDHHYNSPNVNYGYSIKQSGVEPAVQEQSAKLVVGDQVVYL